MFKPKRLTKEGRELALDCGRFILHWGRIRAGIHLILKDGYDEIRALRKMTVRAQGCRGGSQGVELIHKLIPMRYTQGPPTGCDSPSSAASGRNRENSVPPAVSRISHQL